MTANFKARVNDGFYQEVSSSTGCGGYGEAEAMCYEIGSITPIKEEKTATIKQNCIIISNFLRQIGKRNLRVQLSSIHLCSYPTSETPLSPFMQLAISASQIGKRNYARAASSRTWMGANGNDFHFCNNLHVCVPTSLEPYSYHPSL